MHTPWHGLASTEMTLSECGLTFTDRPRKADESEPTSSSERIRDPKGHLVSLGNLPPSWSVVVSSAGWHFGFPGLEAGACDRQSPSSPGTKPSTSR